MSDENYSRMLKDSEKINLGREDLFDRVINLKFKVVSTEQTLTGLKPIEQEYVLRSDYEIFQPNEDITRVLQGSLTSANKSYHIRKCALKPSVKVQYKGITNNTSIEFDIYISNFFMFNKDGQRLMQFNMNSYKLEGVEVMMGYWGQFKNFPHDTINDLFDFKPRYGVDKISCNVLYVTTDKLPPDYDLHIHCYIGNTVNAPTNVNTTFGTSLADLQKSGMFTDFTEANVKKSPMENLLYKYVTKRYLRETDVPQEIFNQITNDIKKDGYMSDNIANKYGVKCYTSPVVDKLEIKGLKDSEGNEVTTGIFAENIGTNLQGTIIALNNKTSNVTLLTKPLLSGDIIVYTSEEVNKEDGLRELAKSMADKLAPYYKGTAAEYYEGNIPAVYNITVDVITQIVCPFYFFVDLFQPIYFASRYALGKMTSYIADFTANRMKFLAYSMTVTFATVEDVNEMQIECVTY